MSDIYKEYLVKRKKKISDFAMQIVIVVLGILLAFFAFVYLGGFLGSIVSIAVVFGGYKLFLKMNKEYEYILTNSELDIDVIYSKQERKRRYSLNMKKIDIMVSIENKDYMNQLKRQAKLIDASDGKLTKETYAILVPEETGYKKILITPNDTFLNYLYKTAPTKVIK